MITLQKPRIAIYADLDSKAAPSPIDTEMHRVFSPAHFDYVHVDRHALMQPSFYKDLAMLIIPGISGEVSFYHDHIGPANAMIRSYVAQGGALFTQCAGSCYASYTTQYTPEWATPRKRESGLLKIFRGVAHGPVPGLGVDGGDSRFHRGLTSIRLNSELAPSGSIAVAYSSGPAFFAAANMARPVEVIARYADTADKTPAIISFGFGDGMVLMSGPVPHQGYTQVADLPQYRALRTLMDKLEPYEEQRRVFFDALMTRILTHTQKTGLSGPV